MKVIENEFVVKAGRSAFRKARKKAFALLKTHGYRNYISVEVCCKRVIKESIWQLGVGVIYNCTLWIEKHTNIIRLYEGGGILNKDENLGHQEFLALCMNSCRFESCYSSY